jgi:hypothetical protein
VKIRLLLPRSPDARFVYDHAKGEIVIEPLFISDKGARAFMHAIVEGSSGRERIYTATIGARNGRLAVTEMVNVNSHFDSLGPTDELGDDRSSSEGEKVTECTG